MPGVLPNGEKYQLNPRKSEIDQLHSPGFTYENVTGMNVRVNNILSVELSVGVENGSTKLNEPPSAFLTPDPAVF